MAYTAEIGRANPSCFLFLIDQSGSMSDQFVSEAKQKAEGVADVINRLMQNLIIKCSKSGAVRDYFEMGVIGYGGCVSPAFGGDLAGRDLISISEVAEHPVRMEKREKKEPDGAGGIVKTEVDFPVWFDPIAEGGTPMCEALERAHRILTEWVQRHPKAYPPIVINITDGEATDGNPIGPAQRLMNLATDDGNVLLYNCHISSQVAKPVRFPDTDRGLPDEFAQMLFKTSSIVPDNIRLAAQEELQKDGIEIKDQARGFVFNADLVELITFLDIGTRPSSSQLR